MSSKEKKSSDFLKQGSILAAASIIVRIIGMIYRIPMSNILGEEGNGIYAVAFDIYDILLIISSYSLPIALSKIISAQHAKRQYKNIGKTFRLSIIFALVSGGGFGLFLFFGAGFIEDKFYPTYSGVQIPLRVIAPTIFIVAILGVFRGFFQGKKTMVPTAVSQIIEQLVNAFVSVYAASSFIVAHAASKQASAWGAAGGTLGTCIGALAGLLFILFLYTLYRPIQKSKERTDPHTKTKSAKYIYYILFMTVIPIILSQTVYQVSGLVDYYVFGDIMADRGATAESIKSLIGIYSSKYRLLCSVPIAISTAISSSMIPSTVSSYVDGKLGVVREKIASAVKFNMIIGFPCALGLGILGTPIVRVLFPHADAGLSGMLLLSGCFSVVFFALSNVTGGALQSIDHMRLPVIHSAISLLIHVILVIGLLKFTNLGLYALIIGNVTFPIVVFVMNFCSLRKFIDYKQEIIKTFLTPLSASLWMGIVIFLLYYGGIYIIDSSIIMLTLSVGVGAIVYFAVYFLLHGVTKEELFDFPMGRKMYVVARKFRLMR